jgi:hypothetical protein
MDLDHILRNVETIDFPTLEKASQECSQRIVFEHLDKKKTLEHMPDYIKKCERILSVYRVKLFDNYKKDLADVKIEANSGQ